MTSEELREAISRLNPAQVLKLKDLGAGVKVARVLGSRVLVKTIEPYTDADRVEKAGLLYIPEAVKEKVTPPPSTGVVVGVGEAVSCKHCSRPPSQHKQECEYAPCIVEGEFVLFSRYAGSDFVIGEEAGFKILDVAEILCTLEVKRGAIAPVKQED